MRFILKTLFIIAFFILFVGFSPQRVFAATLVIPLEDGSGQVIHTLQDTEVFANTNTSGFRVYSSDYLIHFRPYARMSFENDIRLLQGSVWVLIKDKSEGDAPFAVRSGDLEITTLGGEFLLYASPDLSELVVKVLNGTVKVNLVERQQTASLEKGTYTLMSKEGYLIVPLTFDLNALSSKWWMDLAYQDERIADAPTANAGNDQNVPWGVNVKLNGLQSQFKDGDVFEWTLEEGPTSEVVYDTSDITQPVFTPPSHGVYTFSLVIVDKNGVRSQPDYVQIKVGDVNNKDNMEIFTDVKNDAKYYDAIKYLYEHGVIQGYYDDSSKKRYFYPESPVTRAQALKIFFLGSNREVSASQDVPTSPFSDIDVTQWYAPFVFFAKSEGIVQGNPDGTYQPDMPVNRAAALKIALAVNNVELPDAGIDGASFSDVQNTQWYASAMAYAYEHTLFDADSKNNVYPSKDMTRAEVADLMYRLISSGAVGIRGKLTGYVVKGDGVTPLPQAQIQIYSTKQISIPDTQGSTTPVYEADTLLRTVTSEQDGSFIVTLPIGYYSISVLFEEAQFQRSFIVEIRNQKVANVTLQVD